jgi:uncharacterized membrane protein (UPF0127 family)
MVTLNVRILRGLFEKSTGLIGKNKIEPVCFTTRWGIHTFGVLSPIDVLILDSKFRVVKMVQQLRPNHLFFWNPKYYTIIELPAGTIAKNDIKTGDIISLLFRMKR